jgi:hypothetical protein
MENLGIFFGLFYDHWKYFVVIFVVIFVVVLPRFGILDQEKSGNPAVVGLKNAMCGACLAPEGCTRS